MQTQRAGAEPAFRQSTAYVYLASIAAALGGLLFGYDIAVINGAILFLEKQFKLSTFQTEIAASALLAGCVAGAALAGALSDRFGRKKVLLGAAALFLVSSLGASLPRTLAQFTVARLLGGFAVGMESMLAPLYVAEISPARIRGRLVALNQLTIVIGLLLAYLASWLLAGIGDQCWRWMFASAALPSLLFLLAFARVPESPRWLIKQGRSDEARAVLSRVGANGDVDREVAEIEEAIATEEAVSLGQLLAPGLRRPLVIAVALAVLQQVTGINVIFFYGSKIFAEHVAGQTTSSALWFNVIVGMVNLAMTVVAMAIIDKLGRKPILLISSGGMGLSMLLLGVTFRVAPGATAAIIGLMLASVCCFSVGLGPGVWVLMSELFPTRVRGRAMSVATISLWMACLALTLTFLSLLEALGYGAFWIYGAMCALTFLFVWRFVPETKGKSLEQIERWWKRG
jgi:sugar porter (SP) family MFS transporter